MEKIIHYCWFGPKKKPRLIKKCISSWKKYASDFEIIEWNETNFAIDDAPRYVVDAYKAKKYAFVSDYVRFFVMKKYGGIYLDTDVELIKELNSISFHIPFFALEKSVEINPGLIMGLHKNDPICDFMISSYKNATFYTDKYNITVCQRITEFFERMGFVKEDKSQKLDKYFIYSSEFFSPYDERTKKMQITENTISIHWFNASWLTTKEKLGKNFLISKIIKFKNKLFKRGQNGK